ncbi:MAG: VWA domain-containing protein [Solirubrobacterales bacterium]
MSRLVGGITWIACVVAAVVVAQGGGSTAVAQVAPPTTEDGTCAPLDVAIVLDTSGSMDPAIANVKRGIGSLIDEIERASGGDYRIALIDFGIEVTVHVPFSDQNGDEVRKEIRPLSQDGGDLPEPWDEALETVIDGRSEKDLRIQNGDFSEPFRPQAEKLIVLVTDALPAGVDDSFSQSDFDHAFSEGAAAAESDIRISSLFVPNGNDQGQRAADALETTAEASGGTYFETAENGSNLADGVNLAVSACAEDTDRDGLFDRWEEDGYDADGDGEIDVDLPAMGADPMHKDLFIQVGWMQPDGARPCILFFCPGGADGPHPPSTAALERIVNAYANAPVQNPDGEDGISAHFDAGAFTPDSGIPPDLREPAPLGHEDVAIKGSEPSVEDEDRVFRQLAKRFPQDRRALFTFVAYVHDIETPENGYLGLASAVPGDTVMIAGRRMDDSQKESATLFHELGHTLGLRHGGDDDVNGKPNYLSVMNYDNTFPGGIQIGDKVVIDYSAWDLPDLDERKLDEGAGISDAFEPIDPRQMDPPSEVPLPEGIQARYHCGPLPKDPMTDVPELTDLGVPVDWNCDGDSTDVLRDPVHRYGTSNEPPTLLTSRNDWAGIVFRGGVRGGLESQGEPISDGDEGLTDQAYAAVPKTFEVKLVGPGSVQSDGSAGELSLPFIVENTGTDSDTYSLAATYSDEAGNEPALELPDDVDLAAGDSEWVSVDLELPAGLAEGDRAQVVLAVDSDSSDTAAASAVGDISVGPPAVRATQGGLDVNPDPVDPGADVEVSGSGFGAGAPVTLRIEGNGWDQPASQIADENGEVSFGFAAADEPQRSQIEMVGPTEEGLALMAATPDNLDAADTEAVEYRRLSAEIKVGKASKLRLYVGGGGALLLLLLVAFLIWRRRRKRRAGRNENGTPPATVT